MKLVLVSGAILTTLLLGANPAGALYAKQKADAVDLNDPSLRLFQLLDGSYGGKLSDFYVMADVYPDPKNAGQELQRVLRVGKAIAQGTIDHECASATGAETTDDATAGALTNGARAGNPVG